ncbi:hypothetical protein [Xanthomonas arboricola]|uniref:hypothetical protein n=1 Tax=Xanthomonas arboricola TaxID=56448 RepID=UPI004040A36A
MTTTEDFLQCVVCQGMVNHVCRCSCGHADPDADERQNELPGNSGQLQAEQQAHIEELTELRRLVPSVNQRAALDAAIAALAARLPAQGGTLIGWRMIDGARVFEVASHSGIVDPQQFVLYADYIAARQPVGRLIVEDAVALIVRGCCESEPADPSQADTVCINVNDLETIVLAQLESEIVEATPPAPAAVPVDTFQAGVSRWMGECFLPSLYSNMTERGDRLLEEVLELLQSNGYDPARVQTLVQYVYGRPVGDPAQEVGGVMVTLAGYCSIAGLNMHDEGARELARITQPEVMAKIRRKQEAKNALHFDTPLPGHATHPQPAAAKDCER